MKFLYNTNTVLTWTLEKLIGISFFNEDNLRAGLLDNKYYIATVQSVRHAATDTYRQKLVPSPSDQKILEEEKFKLLFQPHDIDKNESRFG